jgi:amino acid adenylation domain-containing protein
MSEQWFSYVELFTSTAARLSDKAAIVFEGRSVTYGELDAASSVIGRELAATCDVPGKIIPVMLPRSPESIAAIMGIWKAGAAGTMVDIGYPKERIDDILEQCGNGFVIDSDWIKALDPFGKTVPSDYKPAKLARDELALVVFTSGSTGRSKGAMLSNRAIAQVAKNASRFYIEDDVYLSIVSFSFVLLLSQEMTLMILGGTIHIAPENIRQDLPQLARYSLDHGITMCFLPFLMVAPFLKLTGSSLRVISVGSERISNLWNEKPFLYASYGSSETAGPICTFMIDKLYENTPLGVAYPNIHIYLLDADGNQVPDGETGEMYISGDQVAMGYLNMPELTAETFVPNPFSDDPRYKTLYRTHDIFRLDVDGNYEFIQRADWMIKIRGYRVEPGEIEIAMRKAAPITNVVVVGFESKVGASKDNQTRLYACYTANEKIEPKMIRKAIADILPGYMVPAFIEQVDALPVNANGKIDRSKITPPEIERFKAEYEAPANDTEKTICEAFAKVLGIDRAGVLDEFTLLGGDSVSAAKVYLALPEEMGLSVADIIAKQTARALAELAEIHEKNWSASKIPDSVEKNGKLELTPFHKIFYYEWLLDPERSDYNITDSRYFNGPVPYEKLNNALITFVNNHYLMNSNVFVDKDDSLFWKKRDAIPSDAHFVKYIDHPLSDEEIYSLVSTPFNLEKDPLVRYFLIKENDARYRFVSVTHHLVMDGTKSDEIYEAMRRCFNKSGFKAEKSLEEQFAHIGRLSGRLNRILESNRESIDAFWRNYLKNAVPVDLKFLKIPGTSKNALPAIPVGASSFTVNRKDLENVRVISRKYGITPYIYGQIIFAIMLNKMTGQGQLSFAFPAIIPEGIPLIYGAHVNTLVANYSMNDDTTFEGLAEQARNYFRDLELSKARYLPVNEIAKYLDNKEVLDALFAQTSLRYNKYQLEGIDREEPDESLCIDLNGSFVFEQEERDNKLYFRLRYKNRIFDKELIGNFTGMYNNLFLQIANDLLTEIDKE